MTTLEMPTLAQIQLANDLKYFEEGDTPMLQGYAVVWDAVSGDKPMGFRFPRGAKFAWHEDMRFLWQHDNRFVLARQSNNTLRFQEDQRGVWFRAQPDLEQSFARDVVQGVKNGNITGVSFDAFNMRHRRNGRVFDVLEARTSEISAVGNPAFRETSIAARFSDNANKLALMAMEMEMTA